MKKFVVHPDYQHLSEAILDTLMHLEDRGVPLVEIGRNTIKKVDLGELTINVKKFKIPIILHCRDSFEETIELIESVNDEELKGVFHCFTGSVEDAKRVEALGGFYLGIVGVATFKNGGMDKVLPDLKLDQLLLETDSPYLAPVPYRGKRNETSYIPIIAERVAEIMEKDVEEVAEATTTNTENLFNL